jgi:hypothetical protein
VMRCLYRAACASLVLLGAAAAAVCCAGELGTWALRSAPATMLQKHGTVRPAPLHGPALAGRGPSRVPVAAGLPRQRDPIRVSVGMFDLGLSTGDWKLDACLVTSTDGRYDTTNSKERARRYDDDVREAMHRGEVTPNPVSDMLHPVHASPRAEPGFVVAQAVAEQIQWGPARIDDRQPDHQRGPDPRRGPRSVASFWPRWRQLLTIPRSLARSWSPGRCTPAACARTGRSSP